MNTLSKSRRSNSPMIYAALRHWQPAPPKGWWGSAGWNSGLSVVSTTAWEWGYCWDEAVGE